MAISVKSVLALAAVAVLATGLGFYGLSDHAVGQESKTSDPFAVEGAIAPPAPTTVQVIAAPAAASAAESQAEPGAAASSTSPRLQAQKEIATALDQGMILEFQEAPLSEVVDYLKTAREIPIIIDKKSLDSIGMGSDTPVTVSLAGISLRSCLARVLGELDLDYFIANEMLVITSKDEARTQLDPRIYKTDGLQIPAEKLIEVITGMVVPDTWEETGGTGKITSLGDTANTLVIAQTDQVHDQIADLLEKLREAGVATAPPGVNR